MPPHPIPLIRGLALAAALGCTVLGVEACADPKAVPLPCYGSGISATKIRIQRVDKLDLLVVIDNSLGMGDKQRELARGLPAFIKGLIDPDVGKDGRKPQAVADI